MADKTARQILSEAYAQTEKEVEKRKKAKKEVVEVELDEVETKLSPVYKLSKWYKANQ